MLLALPLLSTCPLSAPRPPPHPPPAGLVAAQQGSMWGADATDVDADALVQVGPRRRSARAAAAALLSSLLPLASGPLYLLIAAASPLGLHTAASAWHHGEMGRMMPPGRF